MLRSIYPSETSQTCFIEKRKYNQSGMYYSILKRNPSLKKVNHINSKPVLQTEILQTVLNKIYGII